jgi:hypothetical protein
MDRASLHVVQWTCSTGEQSCTTLINGLADGKIVQNRFEGVLYGFMERLGACLAVR